MSEQRPWLKNYPEGVPANINPDAYSDLISLMDETFKKYGNKSYNMLFKMMHAVLELEEIVHSIGMELV